MLLIGMIMKNSFLSINRRAFFLDKTMEGHKIKTKSKFKVRHQKHKLFRANEPLLSVLMWGVNFTVSLCYSIARVFMGI